MTDTLHQETTYFGGEAESIFPIPFPFHDPAQISAELTDTAGATFDLLPGLEYIVNRVSDGHGELILLEETLDQGKTLRIRVAEPENEEIGADAGATAIPEETGQIAELRHSLAALRLETMARFESIEAALARPRTTGWRCVLIRRVVAGIRRLLAG